MRVAKFGHDGCREVRVHQRGYLTAQPLATTADGERFLVTWHDLERRSRIEPFYRPQPREWSPRV